MDGKPPPRKNQRGPLLLLLLFSPLQICVCLIAKNEATACNTLGDYKKRGRSEGKIDNN
jgi:hypothetical protein